VRRDLARLSASEHDVLVIGGGVHGAAVAHGAARRGLTVALLEASDFASGASWNSLKTIHGGLRHLQRCDLPGLRESARERRAMMALAPALVRPLAFLVPVYGHGPRGREALSIGLRAFDLLTADLGRGLPPERRLPPGRMLGPAEVVARFPQVPRPGLTGGALWHDAQVESSERLVIGLLRAAADAGAALANYAEATGLLRDGSRVRGATVRDAETGATFDVRARLVVGAAGAAHGALTRMAGIAGEPPPLLDAMNLVLSRAVVAGAAVGARTEGRFLFLVPWRGRAMVGTEYGTPAVGTREWAEEFLEVARRAFPWAGLRTGDVALVHRGMVPGRSGTRLVTRHRVIDHERRDGTAGLVSVVSAKYTTARAAAEEAVDLAVRRLGRGAAAPAGDPPELPWARLLEGPLDGRARLAARDEMALHVADAVLRRLDLGTAGPPAAEDVDAVAAAMASELGWSAERRASETRAFWTTLAAVAPAVSASGPARISAPS
jgi:glycerol-3-phosphate dehydrogenase